MNNIVQFPIQVVRASRNNKVGEYERKLLDLSIMLDARYDRLSELADEIARVEKSCEDLEGKYEIILKEYSDRVGPANVDIEFYDYSSEVEIKFEPETNNFYIDNVDRTADHRKYLNETQQSDLNGGDIA